MLQLFDQIVLVIRGPPMQLLRLPYEDGEGFQPWLLEDSPARLLLAFGHGFSNKGVHSLEGL